MFIAVRTGLEPATPGVTGRYSNQLNYRTNINQNFCAERCFSRTRMQRYANFLMLQIFFENNSKNLQIRLVARKKTGQDCSGPAGVIPQRNYSILITRLLSSILFFSTLGITMLRTPFSTFAVILSFSTSSGRIIVCWNLV